MASSVPTQRYHHVSPKDKTTENDDQRDEYVLKSDIMPTIDKQHENGTPKRSKPFSWSVTSKPISTKSFQSSSGELTGNEKGDGPAPSGCPTPPVFETKSIDKFQFPPQFMNTGFERKTTFGGEPNLVDDVIDTLGRSFSKKLEGGKKKPKRKDRENVNNEAGNSSAEGNEATEVDSEALPKNHIPDEVDFPLRVIAKPSCDFAPPVTRRLSLSIPIRTSSANLVVQSSYTRPNPNTLNNKILVSSRKNRCYPGEREMCDDVEHGESLRRLIVETACFASRNKSNTLELENGTLWVTRTEPSDSPEDKMSNQRRFITINKHLFKNTKRKYKQTQEATPTAADRSNHAENYSEAEFLQSLACMTFENRMPPQQCNPSLRDNYVTIKKMHGIVSYSGKQQKAGSDYCTGQCVKRREEEVREKKDDKRTKMSNDIIKECYWTVDKNNNNNNLAQRFLHRDVKSVLTQFDNEECDTMAETYNCQRASSCGLQGQGEKLCLHSLICPIEFCRFNTSNNHCIFEEDNNVYDDMNVSNNHCQLTSWKNLCIFSSETVDFNYNNRIDDDSSDAEEEDTTLKDVDQINSEDNPGDSEDDSCVIDIVIENYSNSWLSSKPKHQGLNESGNGQRQHDGDPTPRGLKDVDESAEMDKTHRLEQTVLSLDIKSTMTTLDMNKNRWAPTMLKNNGSSDDYEESLKRPYFNGYTKPRFADFGSQVRASEICAHQHSLHSGPSLEQKLKKAKVTKKDVYADCTCPISYLKVADLRTEDNIQTQVLATNIKLGESQTGPSLQEGPAMLGILFDLNNQSQLTKLEEWFRNTFKKSNDIHTEEKQCQVLPAEIMSISNQTITPNVSGTVFGRNDTHDKHSTTENITINRNKLSFCLDSCDEPKSAQTPTGSLKLEAGTQVTAGDISPHALAQTGSSLMLMSPLESRPDSRRPSDNNTNYIDRGLSSHSDESRGSNPFNKDHIKADHRVQYPDDKRKHCVQTSRVKNDAIYANNNGTNVHHKLTSRSRTRRYNSASETDNVNRIRDSHDDKQRSRVKIKGSFDHHETGDSIKPIDAENKSKFVEEIVHSSPFDDRFVVKYKTEKDDDSKTCTRHDVACLPQPVDQSRDDYLEDGNEEQEKNKNNVKDESVFAQALRQYGHTIHYLIEYEQGNRRTNALPESTEKKPVTIYDDDVKFWNEVVKTPYSEGEKDINTYQNQTSDDDHLDTTDSKTFTIEDRKPECNASPIGNRQRNKSSWNGNKDTISKADKFAGGGFCRRRKYNYFEVTKEPSAQNAMCQSDIPYNYCRGRRQQLNNNLTKNIADPKWFENAHRANLKSQTILKGNNRKDTAPKQGLRKNAASVLNKGRELTASCGSPERKTRCTSKCVHYKPQLKTVTSTSSSKTNDKPSVKKTKTSPKSESSPKTTMRTSGVARTKKTTGKAPVPTNESLSKRVQWASSIRLTQNRATD